jgi:HAD superfamily phosphoserine phosphatase-like hydrolase
MHRFVATDLEGTLSTGEAWRGIAAYLKTHGRARDHQIFFATHFVPALLVRLGVSDKLTFRNQWLIDQAKLLKGYSSQELDTLADWVVEHELWAKHRANVITELQRHHNAGCTVIIATGAYEPIAQALARRFPFDNVQVAATPLEMKDGHFTGKFAAEIGVDALKAQRVRALVGDGTLVAAYGDTAADAPMLELSAEPVAVSPDAALAKIAAEKGWRILE